MTTTLYSTFSVDDRYVGIPVDRVQEVLLAQPLTPVPLAHDHISGLINLRGQIVTAVDLRRRLGLPDRAADQQPMNVVVRTTDGVVSLLVDEIGDVLDVTEAAFEAAPETLTGTARELVTGVYKLPERLLLVLDVERTVQVAHEEPAR
jgi:purine-binding chemotaxis protein CheW